MRNPVKSIIYKIILSIAAIMIGLIPSYFANASTISANTIYVPLVNAKQAQPTPIPTSIPTPIPTTTPIAGIYYVSLTGNDNRSGKTETDAWATFNRAWQSLYPGDTLVLLDGVYHQSLNPNVRNGQPGKPITIRAKNDGKAIVDGDYVRTPVKLGDTWPGPIGNYFVIEGIVARNSVDFVIMINSAHHNILRRVSAYNANTDTNSAVIGIIWDSSQYNLLEDVVAAGTGRKMIYIYEGTNNVIRRSLAYWNAWDGRNWHDSWPWGDNIQIYNGKNNIIENSIGYGPSPYWSISIQANSDNATCIGNQILGSMAIGSGMNLDGTVKNWGTTRPQPSVYNTLTDFENWPGVRSGFMVFGQGIIQNNVLRDILAYGNAGLGFTSVRPYGPGPQNSIVDHATIIHNGLDAPQGDGGVGTDALMSQLSDFSVTNSYVEGTSYQGSGARLTKRYVNGVMTNDALWPWPMEQRIRSEMGFSVTNILAGIIPSQVSQIP